MKQFIVFFALFSISFACESWPNGTDTKLSWYNCDPSLPIQVQQNSVDAGDGQPDYPVRVKTVILSQTFTNTGPAYNQVYINATLSFWGGLLGCSWHNYPALGLLSNLNGCQIAQDCPIKTGTTTFKTQLNMGLFAPVVELLGSGKPLQLELKTLNGDDPSRPAVGCVRAQFQIEK